MVSGIIAACGSAYGEQRIVDERGVFDPLEQRGESTCPFRWSCSPYRSIAARALFKFQNPNITVRYGYLGSDQSSLHMHKAKREQKEELLRGGCATRSTPIYPLNEARFPSRAAVFRR